MASIIGKDVSSDEEEAGPIASKVGLKREVVEDLKVEAGAESVEAEPTKKRPKLASDNEEEANAIAAQIQEDFNKTIS